MVTKALEEVFSETLAKGINVYGGGRKEVDYLDLTDAELKAVNRCIDDNLVLLESVSPNIARTLREQREFLIRSASVAKAYFPTPKPITYPAQPGTIGVNFLIPQAIKYVATPSPSNPAYTSYKTNLWEIDLTPGTSAWLLGDGTNYYKACGETGKHVLLAIIKDGVIEVGSTPKIDQFHLFTEIEKTRAPYTVHPLVEEKIENHKVIYQYPTMGALLVYHDLGVMWGMMPKYAGTAVIKLLGLYFYEYDFHSALKWIT
jgi:hypothetical protein